MTNPRTFIVRVSESPPRVIVEDVRYRRRVVADGLGDVGEQITVWLKPRQDALPDALPDEAGREDSVSPAP